MGRRGGGGGGDQELRGEDEEEEGEASDHISGPAATMRAWRATGVLPLPAGRGGRGGGGKGQHWAGGWAGG